jgi:hypothetical protein
MPGAEPDAAGLERIRLLARDLAASDPGPAADLGSALVAELELMAGRVDAIAARLDGLWQLITAVVESAGLAGAAGSPGPAEAAGGSGGPDGPPPEFLQAVSAPRRAGDRALRLNLNNREWVAAISQDEPPADPARTWAALERLTRDVDEQDDEGQA